MDPRFCNKPADWHRWTFHEKIGWRCRNPSPDVDYAALADKSRAKELAQSYFAVARSYRLVRRADDIERRELPDCYVMKTTHSWNRSMLVRDSRFTGTNRNRFMVGERAHNIHLRRLARDWLQRDYGLCAREYHYHYVEPGILFEEYLDPVDYELQFFLFSGVCRMTMAVKRPFHHRKGVLHRLYDQHWKRLEPGSADTAGCYDCSAAETPRPADSVFASLHAMCRHIDHVRADFYASGGRLYFGEFTFTHNGGRPSLLGRHEAELSRSWPEVNPLPNAG